MSDSGGRPVAGCPHCQKRFDVSAVLGNPQYDLDPNQPGQQVRCPACAEMFTLPGR